MRPALRNGRTSIEVFSLALALLVASCGGGTGADSGATTTDESDSVPPIEPTSTTAEAVKPTTTEAASAEISPCEIVGTSKVEAAFRGTVSPGADFPGGTCRYAIEDGAAEWVDVLYLGTAEEWDDVTARYESNRGGIVHVEGVGEDAFHPQDHGVRDLIFVANGNIYGVLGFGGPTEEQLKELGESVAALAMTIADPNG